MKLNTKCRYGARAVVEIAKNHQISATKRKDIVKAQDITDSYLENILVALRDSNIIETKRGARGGFYLKREPHLITLLDIVVALNGPIAPVECLHDLTRCDRWEKCITRPIWQKIKEAQEKILREVTVENLVKDLRAQTKET